MILYHGTCTKYLPAILEEGLKGAGKRGVKRIWKGAQRSMQGWCYLSQSFPAFYAMNAAGQTNSKPVILQVNVQEHEIYPDEDFIRFALKANPATMPIVKLEEYGHHALDSLKHMGVVAVSELPPSQIINHVVLPDDWFFMTALGADQSISPWAHQFIGPEYQERLEMLFSKGLDAVKELITEESRKRREEYAEIRRVASGRMKNG